MKPRVALPSSVSQSIWTWATLILPLSWSVSRPNRFRSRKTAWWPTVFLSVCVNSRGRGSRLPPAVRGRLLGCGAQPVCVLSVLPARHGVCGAVPHPWRVRGLVCVCVRLCQVNKNGCKAHLWHTVKCVQWQCNNDWMEWFKQGWLELQPRWCCQSINSIQKLLNQRFPCSKKITHVHEATVCSWAPNSLRIVAWSML